MLYVFVIKFETGAWLGLYFGHGSHLVSAQVQEIVREEPDRKKDRYF